MLDGSELYVILKLSSGEQVMAVLHEEDDERVLIETPMCIRTIPVLDAGREHVTASPLCQFSDDKVFVIHKKDIMFCKKLHHLFIPHYRRIVAEHEKLSFLSKDGSKENKEELSWEDEPLTVEEVRKRINMLQEIVGGEPIEKEEERTFVEGNDTLH